MFKAMRPRKDDDLPLNAQGPGLIYAPPDAARLEMRDIERSFARLFASDDGHKVLAYLQVMTFQRALGPTSPDEQLRYMEGQRSMVATILRLIDRGRNV
jgi:hypothetical protein